MSPESYFCVFEFRGNTLWKSKHKFSRTIQKVLLDFCFVPEYWLHYLCNTSTLDDTRCLVSHALCSGFHHETYIYIITCPYRVVQCPMSCSFMSCSSMSCGSLSCSSMLCGSMLCGSMLCGSMSCDSMSCSMSCSSMLCGSMSCGSMLCGSMSCGSMS